MPVKIKNLKFIDKWGESLENQVLAYEKEPIRKGEIVFYGASNFTRWKEQKYGNPNLREAIVGASGAPCCINRGFGSSCSEHMLYYYDRMVKPLEPRVLVCYCFGNYNVFGYTPEEAWEIGQRLLAYVRNDFPDIHIYLDSAHRGLEMTGESLETRRMLNSWAKKYAEENENCFYVDTFDHPFMQRKDIFAADGSHFNRVGYGLYADIWREALKEELKKF